MKASHKFNSDRQFPPFDLTKLMQTIFSPKPGEKVAVLIDLDHPNDVVSFAFTKKPGFEVQKNAYNVFYKGIRKTLMPQMRLGACDFFAYQTTGGSNLELPEKVTAVDGTVLKLAKDIYPNYDIILCITTYSATAPLTALAKKFGFRGATMHGMNDVILKTGLAVDYNEVSRETEKLRLGMTKADAVDIDFAVDDHDYHLHIDLKQQEAQKSHGLCHTGPDIANLPAGEVYFVPADAKGSFPIKFEDGSLGVMQVDKCKVSDVVFLKGNRKTIQAQQELFKSDPAAGILGELGFGTQVLPYSGRDIQDEKIFGTFHIATGRNDHLNGNVTLDKFKQKRNATHDDILFSSTKTPEIHVKEVRMHRHGKVESLIKNYAPQPYLLNLLKSTVAVGS